MTADVILIGAGWYGCHLATAALKRDMSVEIYDSNDIFSGMSSANQNRLHLGYHYPRSFITREQTREGFNRFIEEYGFLTSAQHKALYAIHRDSIIDKQSFNTIFGAEGYPIGASQSHVSGNFTQVFETDERLIKNETARNFFKEKLSGCFRNGEMSLSNMEGLASKAKVINCSGWSIDQPDLGVDVIYEQFCFHVVKNPSEFNITVMDGPFYSIYPMERSGFSTVTHVQLGVLKKSNTLSEAQSYVEPEVLDKNWLQTIERISEDLDSSIVGSLERVDTILTTKVKRLSPSDARHTSVFEKKGVLHVFPGKIDAVFKVEDLIFG